MRRFLLALAVAATAFSAQAAAPATAAPLSAAPAAAQPNQAPELHRTWVTCADEGARISVWLRSRSRLEESFMVIVDGPLEQSQAVTLAPRHSEIAQFDGLSDGSYLVVVLNAAGDTVATDEIVVACQS